MLKKHAHIFEGFFTAADLIVVSGAWIMSYWLRFMSGYFSIEKGVPPFSDYLKMLFFVWLIWGFVFRRFGLYRPMRGVSRFREIWNLIKANSLSVVLLLTFTYLFREKAFPFSRLVFLIFWSSSIVFTIMSRTVLRGMLRAMRRRGYNLRYALIVGAGDLAGQVAQRMIGHPEYGIELKGCLAHGPVLGTPTRRGNLSLQPEYAQSVAPKLRGKVVGAYEDLPRLLAEGGIDQLIVALPLSDLDQLESVMDAIGDELVDVKIVPDVYKFIQLGSSVEEFDGLPVVSLASTPLSGINRAAKRMFDMVFGTIFFILSLPLMGLAALLVKLSSPGPIFFSQERVGLDGKSFQIFKFRTMCTDAEANGAQFAVKGDTRVTPVGKIMRKLNIDELPQLVNVLRGQMSLVGPRPERPVFIEEFRRHLPRYMLRHKVQAGMTGWAQVHGWRGNTSIERRIEHDFFYIENWSLLLDLKILALTIFKGFRDRNAY